ncbi:MAG: NTP transferase domain-containing protein [Nitriliruptorales bacterium]|nr:NTP transferase domain-containing protein [Nitriliruptorales bacterium]
MSDYVSQSGDASMVDVQAVILAGGKGTRLRPVTVELPKPLIPVANRPLISHQLRHLARSGVKDVALALGYNAEQFEPILDEAAELGLDLHVFTEPKPLGTGGALRWCADQGAFDDRPLLWLNGDVVATPNLPSLLAMHSEQGALVTTWLTSVRDVSEFGVLELNEEGRVERFLEKPSPDDTDSHLVNSGILMLDPRVLERIPSGRMFSFEQSLLPDLVEEGAPLYGLFDGGYWMDTGRPRQYLDANRHVLEGRVDWSPKGALSGDGIWEGDGVKRDVVGVIQPAALGDGVVIESGAQLFGRVVLGDNVVVREHAKLEDCVVFAGAEIAGDAEVFNSIVCADARIAEHATVERSIVGARTTVGKRNELRGTRLWNDVQLPDGVVAVDM